jgi:Glutaminase
MPGPPPLPIIVDPSWLGALVAAVAKALGLGGGGGPALGTGGAGTPGSPGNPLTLAQAEAVFKEVAGKSYIPFNWPRDGCYARAHEMRKLMTAEGIESRKVFNYASPTGTGMEVKGTSIGDVQWGYHVAPIIAVKGSDGVTRDMVIDPSLGDKLITVDEWKGKQGDPNSTIEKADGSVVYKPQGMSDTDPAVMKDDDNKKTDAALEHFRRERAMWDTGVDPATGLPHK